MSWNQDLSSAPRGKSVTRHVTHKDGKTPYEAFIEEPVILTTKCGKVIRSYWLPKEDRWAGLSKGEMPIAWQPWPDAFKPDVAVGAA
jgi:hypothetical protein